MHSSNVTTDRVQYFFWGGGSAGGVSPAIWRILTHWSTAPVALDFYAKLVPLLVWSFLYAKDSQIQLNGSVCDSSTFE